MNPFTPTFGMVPPYLAGRQSLITSMRRAFQNGPGDPNLSSVLVGPRGSGKTALLSCIGDEAMKEGWLVADTVAADNMLDDILQRTQVVGRELLKNNEKKQLTGIGVGQMVSLTWESDQAETKNWRTKMSALLNELNKTQTGLLITVDEVRADIPEMIQLASMYQLFIREHAKIALVMAGLPVNINQLISHKEVSFLRRARQHYAGRIADRDIRSAFRKTIESAGKRIEDDALSLAVEAAGGFAYMMQLVGYAVWEESGEKELIDTPAAKQGIEEAKEDFKRGVLDRTWRELSKGDKKILEAMLKDQEYSTVTDIAKRIGKTPGYVSTYKTRLLMAGVIKELEGAVFTIAIPSFREYIKNQSL